MQFNSFKTLFSISLFNNICVILMRKQNQVDETKVKIKYKRHKCLQTIANGASGQYFSGDLTAKKYIH